MFWLAMFLRQQQRDKIFLIVACCTPSHDTSIGCCRLMPFTSGPRTRSRAGQRLPGRAAYQGSSTAAAEAKESKRGGGSAARAAPNQEAKHKVARRHGSGLGLHIDTDDDTGGEPIAGAEEKVKESERSIGAAFSEHGIVVSDDDDDVDAMGATFAKCERQ
jgi:hypothetical protein